MLRSASIHCNAAITTPSSSGGSQRCSFLNAETLSADAEDTLYSPIDLLFLHHHSSSLSVKLLFGLKLLIITVMTGSYLLLSLRTSLTL